MICVDEQSFSVLLNLDLHNVSLSNLGNVKTTTLKEVKPSRTRGEYCWTLTPSAPRSVFAADPSDERVTYVDAALWFRKRPDPLFAEFEKSGHHLRKTEHRYSTKTNTAATHGQNG